MEAAPRQPWKPDRWSAAAIAAGVTAVAVSWPLAVQGLSRFEATIFDEVNEAPHWVAVALWPIMQTGTVWMAGATAVVVAVRELRARNPERSIATTHRRRRRQWAAAMAAVAGLTVLVTWYAAIVAKGLVGRGRPSTYGIGVDVFGEAASGFGYVSGHTAVAFAATTVLGRSESPRVRLLLWCIAAVVGVSRIVVGSHLPLDVVGGAGVGLVCGGIGSLVLDRLDRVRCADGV